MSTTTALVSFSELEQLPDEPGRRELIDGELIEMPPPLLSHLVTAKRIARQLETALGEDRVFVEAGYKIGTMSWLQPDVSVLWPDQKMERGYPAGSPMLAVEILSEHKSAQYVEDKLNLYFENGAKEVWTVSRTRISITVHRKAENSAHTSFRVTDSYQPDWLSVAVRPAELIVP